MQTPQITRDATRSLIVALLALAVLFLPGCAGTTQAVPMAYACGTTDVPPIAVGRARCDTGAAGFRWYSGRADDLDEPDEAVVIGQPLDEDWWDAAAQADLDDRHAPRVSTPRPAPRPAPKATTAKAPARSTR